MQFWKIVAQALPEGTDDYPGSIVGMLLSSRRQQLCVALPKAKIVPDPLAKAKVEYRQFVLWHLGDLRLLILGDHPLEYAHCSVDADRHVVSHRVSPCASPRAA